ncbi:MAG TPA: MBOAT family O-acyltransferase [Candidatus Binatia bacterium]|nr:MBOAT family O-acyltransferase [Candidatus Binatia bacterium]
MIPNTFIAVSLALLLWVLAWHLRSVKVRQILLLGASYLFYAEWGYGFLSVLIASSLLNYAWGFVLRRRATAGSLWIGVSLNLLILSFFKYLPPLLEFGLASEQSHVLRSIVMPVGISFWTFQGIAYLFDLYRGEELDPSLAEFCLYMAFWPTVLSGPICRLPDMLLQFRSAAAFTWENFTTGLRRLIQGLLMKMVLAQLLGFGLSSGAGVSAGFDQLKGDWGGIDVWLLAIGFGFQLFFDFAGYSHIVIGTARLFGIRIEENFDRPFFSTTPSLFWSRWHMSLSFWIRDYVFLPLAGACRDYRWPYVALVVSMSLFGLWHGAKATFIAWGLYHGLLLVGHRLGQQLMRRVPFHLPGSLSIVLSWATTFCLISLGWIFFRAHDLGQVLLMLRAVFAPSGYDRFAMPANFYFLTALVVSGYFIYGITESLLAQRKERSFTSVETVKYARPVAELFEVYALRLRWWTLSMVLATAFFIVLAIVDQRGRIAIPPFMYTGF